MKDEIGGETYLLPRDLFARRCWLIEDGDTEAATLACWDVKADWTAGGIGVPLGKDKPSAPITRMVSRPDLNARFSSMAFGLEGVGVVERLLTSSVLRLLAEVFLPRSQDMVVEMM